MKNITSSIPVHSIWKNGLLYITFALYLYRVTVSFPMSVARHYLRSEGEPGGIFVLSRVLLKLGRVFMSSTG